jgi:hypothetical protein
MLIKTLRSSFVLLPVFLLACSTMFHNPNMELMEEKDYFATIEKSTQRRQVYDGFYATMEFSAVLLNTPSARARVDQMARIYQWDSSKYSDEKAKTESNLAKQTEIFLSFYVPERKNDDLNKSKTLWKIFLDANGKRYEGKVEKIKTNVAEINALYLGHSRWGTPYKLIFNVPTSLIESGKSKLTLTGPVGSAFVEFEPVQIKAP